MSSIKVYTDLSKAISIIKEFEGLRLKAYLCSAGVATIGFGTTRYPNDWSVELGDECTEQEAEEYLFFDVTVFSTQIEPLIKVKLTDNQFAALLSLCYNIGITAFKKSTLLKLLNAGEIEKASAEFDKWNKAGGKVIKGLVNRRAKERELFNTK
jgi:lysozyme